MMATADVKTEHGALVESAYFSFTSKPVDLWWVKRWTKDHPKDNLYVVEKHEYAHDLPLNWIMP